MTRHEQHTAWVLRKARELYELAPTETNHKALQKAKQRHLAAQQGVRPPYLKGERL